VREDMAGDGSGRPSHAGKRKILGDDSTPAGGSEMDRLARHAALLYLVAQARRIGYSPERESQE
jgi:hypothetical protein